MVLSTVHWMSALSHVSKFLYQNKTFPHIQPEGKKQRKAKTVTPKIKDPLLSGKSG